MSHAVGTFVLARLARIEVAAGSQAGNQLAAFLLGAAVGVLVDMEAVLALSETA